MRNLVVMVGVAWLPESLFDLASWVEIIVAEWARSDSVHFPEFGDWTKHPEWMTPEEKEFADNIQSALEEKQQIMAEYDARIGALSVELTQATLNANRTRRRLLTAQGNELVDEVAALFRELGYAVKVVDPTLRPGAPKREDIRLRDSEVSDEWEAIVEVRGYSRSGGTTADLSRLARFESLYIGENGRPPDKKIYVVNGQIELPPSQRQEPLASAPEDVQEFADQNGVIISSLDLFRLSNLLRSADCVALRASINQAQGRWKPAIGE